MELKRSIAAERTTAFYALEDGEFVPWTDGRLAPVDRFLSNFHKPLQRRMLFTDPDVPYPDSRVIRQEATGEIFLLGQHRTDVEEETEIDRLSVLHSVSSDASGIAEYFNYDYDSVDPLNIVDGNIGKTSEGSYYFSVEYQSTRSTEYSDEAFQGKYLVYAPHGTPLKEGGYFTLHSVSYKIVEVFEDSGFTCALLLQHEDDTVPIVYHHINNALSGYDVATGTQTIVTDDYTFAASVDQVAKVQFDKSMYEIYLKFSSSLPVPININNEISYQGNRLSIVGKYTDKNSKGQIKLVCEG